MWGGGGGGGQVEEGGAQRVMYESVYEQGPTLTSGHTAAPEQELSTASG